MAAGLAARARRWPSGGHLPCISNGGAAVGDRGSAVPRPRGQREPPARGAGLRDERVIVVRALGPADVRVDGAAAPAELLWKKNLALLVYLARSPKRLRTREHLVGLLWADKPEKD